MKEYIISKMKESTFDDDSAMLDFLEYDYRILGDEDAFIVYYYLAENMIWVHFLYATDKSKRRMFAACKQLWAESVQAQAMIFFDCDDYERMFKNHSKKVYLWTKEL